MEFVLLQYSTSSIQAHVCEGLCLSLVSHVGILYEAIIRKGRIELNCQMSRYKLRVWISFAAPACTLVHIDNGAENLK